MRILLACHESPARADDAWDTGALAERLRSRGHDVRLWDAERELTALTGAAFPPLDAWPAAWSDDLLAEYLHLARRRLDDLIVAEDPDVIHTDGLWVLAYLALESGVPYVSSVRGGELVRVDTLARQRELIVQAAENAGRLFVADATASERLLAVLPELETPTTVIGPLRYACPTKLSHAYRQVREARCGEFSGWMTAASG
ncbi:MAG: glycosyltransferase [Pirellulales bacterium]|nr:glycosyltransferase [Pirellulales bacterium]